MDNVQEALDAYTAYRARAMKTIWLQDLASRETTVNIIGNEPFRQLYYQFVGLASAGGMVHYNVLREFGVALNRRGWPENDGSRTYKSSKANPYHSSIESTHSSKRKAEHEAEDQPGSSRARRDDSGN